MDYVFPDYLWNDVDVFGNTAPQFSASQITWLRRYAKIRQILKGK